jgi:hypothetical protein
MILVLHALLFRDRDLLCDENDRRQDSSHLHVALLIELAQLLRSVRSFAEVMSHRTLLSLRLVLVRTAMAHMGGSLQVGHHVTTQTPHECHLQLAPRTHRCQCLRTIDRTLQSCLLLLVHVVHLLVALMGLLVIFPLHHLDELDSEVHHQGQQVTM